MKKGLAAAVIVLAAVTVLSLSAGVVLGDTSGGAANRPPHRQRPPEPAGCPR